jgi:hypothetical protein
MATRAVRAWTAAYTKGLPSELRAARRAELASDAWEQLHDPANATTWRVLGRLVRGVPGDLAWRAETRYHLGGFMSTATTFAARTGAALAALVAVVALFVAVAWTEVAPLLVVVPAALVSVALWWVGSAGGSRPRRVAVGATAGGAVVVALALVVAGAG